MTDLIVIGSTNVDQVVMTNRLPNIGETVVGNEFKVVPGGKGANQAISAARLGVNVEFIGCVGNDSNGTFLIENFNKNNVKTESISILKNVSTGIASIRVCKGENSIIVVPGANFSITKEMIDQNIKKILNSKMVLIQLEIPINVVEYIVNICFENKIPVILNPAPAMKLDDKIIDKVNFITPNEHETKIIFETDNFEKIVKAYPNKLIITLGERGALYSDGNKVYQIPAYDVNAIDTTGAGDTFNGALATALINRENIKNAIKFANKASALKIQKMGAQAGMPTLEEMEEFNEKIRNFK